MEFMLYKARDGIYDLFVDNEWKMSTRVPEKIFVYMSKQYENITFTYFDMDVTTNDII